MDETTTTEHHHRHHHHHHSSKKYVEQQNEIGGMDEEEEQDMTEMIQVVLIRHGQSAAQAAHSRDRDTDVALLDAELSSTGIFQAQGLSGIVARNAHAIELVVCSPLSRALQTTRIAFRELQDKVLVHDLFRELNSRHSDPIPENQGRPLRVLKKDFAEFDFSHVGKHWPEWPPGLDEDGLSVGEGLKWLVKCANDKKIKRVVIVAHHNWITCAISGDKNARKVHVENARPIYAYLRASHNHVGESRRSSLRSFPIQLRLAEKDGFEWFS